MAYLPNPFSSNSAGSPETGKLDVRFELLNRQHEFRLAQYYVKTVPVPVATQALETYEPAPVEPTAVAQRTGLVDRQVKNTMADQARRDIDEVHQQ